MITYPEYEEITVTRTAYEQLIAENARLAAELRGLYEKVAALEEERDDAIQEVNDLQLLIRNAHKALCGFKWHHGLFELEQVMSETLASWEEGDDD
jgi:hypothetical protein